MSYHTTFLKGLTVATVMLGVTSLDTASADVPTGLTRLTLLTGAPGGSWYAYSAGLGELLTQAGVPTSLEQGGGNSNVLNIAAGNAEIGFGLTSSNHMARMGAGPFEGRPVTEGVVGVSVLFPQFAHTAVTVDSGVTSYAELRGQRMASQSIATGSRFIFHDTLIAHGIEGGEDEVNVVVRGGPAVGGQAVRDRQAIGFIATVFPPAAAFSETSAVMPIRLLPIEDAYFDRLVEMNPGYYRGVIPAGIYPGLNEDVPTIVDDTVLMASATLPEEHAYWIARTIGENIEGMQRLGPPFRDFSQELMATVRVIDLHPGAARYYREIGVLP